jgi:dUTP pyrophosphatase
LNKFYKVSFEEFNKNFDDILKAKNMYDDIILPKRATKHSAGYDFFAPFDFELKGGESIKIPTGIKCNMNEDLFLAIVPRSSLGFKYKMRLVNTLGVVDCDYFDNENNEGHIFIKISNENNENKTLKVNKGEAFAQGIFFKYFLTEDDNVTETRTGGIGSTNK